ncbi:hypothetical protein DL771_003868 [Monosporascus sp. 5C6A]|nr:hypothetical protein DL771_003868 [Monosporascus sp. 5C6A]
MPNSFWLFNDIEFPDLEYSIDWPALSLANTQDLSQDSSQDFSQAVSQAWTPFGYTFHWAILEYLVEQYDKDHKISYAEAPEKFLAKQWLFFQVSGQGPYYGQAVWFTRYHPEKLPSAVKRYVDEIHRVTGVLEKALEKGDWLVGDKCTYADLSFIAWQRGVPRFVVDIYEKFPKVGAWMKRMESRPAVRKIIEDQDAAIAEMDGKS